MSRFYNLEQAPFNSRELSNRIVAAISSQYNGAYFDAQDLSTMFQDAAGKVPVTAMEQPVGRWLDKSGNGNHATQSMTASRPVVSARYNLLTKTEQLNDTVWNAGASVTYAGSNGYSVARNSSTTETRIRQAITIPPSPVSITLRVKIKANSVTWAKLRLLSIDSSPSVSDDYAFFNVSNGTVGSFGSLVTSAKIYPDGDFFVCEISGVSLPSSSGAPQFVDICPAAYNGAPSGNGSIGESIYVKQPELVFSSNSNMKYQRVTTATDYDTVGFKKYLKFDGIDDFMNMPYLGLYINGSSSIVAARSALSQATDTYVISERSASNVTPKYFPSRQLANAGNMDTYIVNDAATVIADTVGSAYAGASNAVISSAIDSGNNIKLFKNGSLAANDNYTRSGALTLTNSTIGASVSTTTSNYANMKLYGLVIAKSALSDPERRRVERLLAYNSGAQI